MCSLERKQDKKILVETTTYLLDRTPGTIIFQVMTIPLLGIMPGTEIAQDFAIHH